MGFAILKYMDSPNQSYIDQASKKALAARNQAAHEINVAGGEETLDPKSILVKYSIVKTGDTLADLGCGAMPYFSMQAGKIIGQEGKIYIVDIQKTVLAAAESHLKMAGLRNVVPVWSDLEVIGAASIPANSLDAAFIVNVLFQSKTADKIICEASRLLKTGGKLLVIDYVPGAAGFSLPVVSKQFIIDSATTAGLGLEQDFEAGPRHFGLLFSKR